MAHRKRRTTKYKPGKPMGANKKTYTKGTTNMIPNTKNKRNRNTRRKTPANQDKNRGTEAGRNKMVTQQLKRHALQKD